MSVKPVAVLLLVALLAGSSAEGGSDEIVLVSREWADLDWSCSGVSGLTCRIDGPRQVFHDAAGRVATLEPTGVVWRLQVMSGPEAEKYGGEMIRRRTYIYRLAALGQDEEASPQTLVFDDGGAVELFVESFITVVDKCSETVGRWEGVEGEFEGRSGTYRLTDDWLRTNSC